MFGDRALAAPAAGTAAAEAELPGAEPPQPDEDCADIANTPATASGRRMHITDAMVRKFGASMGRPRCRNGMGTPTRAERACSGVWRRRPPSRRRHTQLTWQLTDLDIRREKRGHEDRGGDAVNGAADDLQARSSSQREKSESSKVRRIMGLETWTAEEEPGAEEEEQPGAEEVALERKWQFEAVCPQMA